MTPLPKKYLFIHFDHPAIGKALLTVLESLGFIKHPAVNYDPHVRYILIKGEPYIYTTATLRQGDDGQTITFGVNTETVIAKIKEYAFVKELRRNIGGLNCVFRDNGEIEIENIGITVKDIEEIRTTSVIFKK